MDLWDQDFSCLSHLEWQPIQLPSGIANTVPEAGFLKTIHVQLLTTVLAEMVMSNKTLLLVVQHSFNS